MTGKGWRIVSKVAEEDRPECWSWLTSQGSLTERVRNLESEAPFHLDVLYEAKETLDADAAGLLALDMGDPVMIREVSLNRGTTPVIFARSVIPLGSIEGSNDWLVKLGNQPLGDALYDAGNVERSEFEVIHVDEESMLFTRIASTLGQPDNPVWARRSCVRINGQPILINECFLSIPTS